MSVLRIGGMRKLYGKMPVHGAKNSVLPILAATILNGGKNQILGCPDLKDVDASVGIMRHLGCAVTREAGILVVDSAPITRCDVPNRLMREMRSSVVFLGAILARFGEAVMSYPGGCELGPRPIDLHLSALRELGAEIHEESGNIVCKAEELKGQEIPLSFPSVGATENIMIAATAAKGVTRITNAAREPEIVDLQEFLRGIGANISGAGTSTIEIEGRAGLHETRHRIIADRIVAATYLACAAMAGGEVELCDVIPEHIATITSLLEKANCKIHIEETRIFLKRDEPLKAFNHIRTMPYPGFPTDAQSPMMAVAAKARGTTVFVENIFENRFRHVGELVRMGADIRVEGRVAVVCGTERLSGSEVTCTDLRGGASVVVAALGAEGESRISGLSHLDRGYDGIESVLRAVGADIERIEEEN